MQAMHRALYGPCVFHTHRRASGSGAPSAVRSTAGARWEAAHEGLIANAAALQTRASEMRQVSDTLSR
jgi:hypothetical protein